MDVDRPKEEESREIDKISIKVSNTAKSGFMNPEKIARQAI